MNASNYKYFQVDDILNKPKLKKQDIEFIVERIDVYDDHIDIQLKSDIDALLHVSATQAIEQAAGDESSLVRQVRNHKKDERLINSVRCGDPQQTALEGDVQEDAQMLLTLLAGVIEQRKKYA